MKTKTILVCTIALTVGACGSQSNYTQANSTKEHTNEKLYLRYEQREPCQNYRKLPPHMIARCNKAEEDNMGFTNMQISRDADQEMLPIVSSYTVLFDHDKSIIRANETATIDHAMREISKYNPREVTVTGYTDSSGKIDYNQALSSKREEAVSKALLSRGVENRVLEREARGEYDQAVETKDGIRNQANRRVVIDFRR